MQLYLFNFLFIISLLMKWRFEDRIQKQMDALKKVSRGKVESVGGCVVGVCVWSVYRLLM